MEPHIPGVGSAGMPAPASRPPTAPAAPPCVSRSWSSWPACPRSSLLARIYQAFPLICPACQTFLTFNAFLTDPESMAQILAHIGEPTSPPLTHPEPPHRPHQGAESPVKEVVGSTGLWHGRGQFRDGGHGWYDEKSRHQIGQRHGGPASIQQRSVAEGRLGPDPDPWAFPGGKLLPMLWGAEEDPEVEGGLACSRSFVYLLYNVCVKTFSLFDPRVGSSPGTSTRIAEDEPGPSGQPNAHRPGRPEPVAVVARQDLTLARRGGHGHGQRFG
jgi:hypothetical protein